MMLPGAFTDFLHQHFGHGRGTVVERFRTLQQNGFAEKEGRGIHAAARTSASTAVNGILAEAISHRRGDDVAANVRRARNLRLCDAVVLPPGFPEDSITVQTAKSAGKGLEQFLLDWRPDSFLDEMSRTHDVRSSAHLSDDGASVLISIDVRKNPASQLLHAGVWTFGPKLEKAPLVKRSVTIDGTLFRDLARSLLESR
jgi:hypothetical protein